MDEIRVVVDHRESRTLVSKYLMELQINLTFQSLTVADYVVSNKVAVERKEVNDFINSIFSGRLFSQCQRLREAYEKPILVVEGDLKKALLLRNIKLSSLYGTLSSVVLDYGIPVVPSPTSKATAIFIYRLAYREQVLRDEVLRVRSKPKLIDLEKKQVFFLSGLPRVGNKLALELLKSFSNPYNALKSIVETKIIQSSSGKTLKVEGPVNKVKGFGPLKIKEIKKVLLGSDEK